MDEMVVPDSSVLAASRSWSGLSGAMSQKTPSWRGIQNEKKNRQT